MKKIRVRTVESARDGVVFRWTVDGARRQQVYEGKRTRNRIEDARRELQDELNRHGSRLFWSEYKRRLAKLYFPTLSARTINKVETVLRKWDAVHSDFPCGDLSTGMVLKVQERMLEDGLQPASVHSNMQTLWALIFWGIDHELLPVIRRPRKRKGKQSKRIAKSGGRSLVTEEIERMILMIRANPIGEDGEHLLNPGEDPESFIRAIHAARKIGLRLDDCHRLAWEPGPNRHWVSGRTIVFSDDQKSGLSEEIPLTPAAVDWLETVPKDIEWIARARGERGWHKTHNRLGRVISGAGKAARIVTKPNGGRGGGPKYAGAHDLRRTFATEWLSKLSVKEVQRLTRHADVNTLLTYYADCQVPELTAKLKSGGESVGMTTT